MSTIRSDVSAVSDSDADAHNDFGYVDEGNIYYKFGENLFTVAFWATDEI